MRRLVAVALLLLVMSGCARADPLSPTSSSTVPACMCVDGTGQVEGVVYDAEFTPLTGARVNVSGHPTSVVTDGGGSFVVPDVLVGDHVVTATLPGYTTASQQITVGEGEILSMRLELDVIPIVVVYPELVQYTGHMTAGLSTALYAFRPGTELEDELEFGRELKPDARTIVATMTFQRTSAAGAEKFQLDSILDGLLYNQTYGESPLLNRVEDVPLGSQALRHSIWLPRTCDYYILASCYADPPSSLVQFALDQRFDVYSTVFYGGPAPAGYTGLPS